MEIKNQIKWKITISGNLILLMLSTLLLQGCAAVGTGEKFSLAKPEQNKVIIYHYRESGFKGSALSYDVLSNNKPLTRIGNGGYFQENTTPGVIEYKTLVSSYKGPIFFIWDALDNSLADFEKAYSLKAEGGKVYFLRWSPKIFGGPPEIKLVGKNEALGDISGLRAYPPAQQKKESVK